MNEFDNGRIMKFNFIDPTTNEIVKTESMTLFDAKLFVINNDLIMQLVEE